MEQPRCPAHGPDAFSQERSQLGGDKRNTRKGLQPKSARKANAEALWTPQCAHQVPWGMRGASWKHPRPKPPWGETAPTGVTASVGNKTGRAALHLL